MVNKIARILAFLEKSPEDAFLTHALALEYIKISDFETARACFTQNKNKHPEYVGTYYHLGKLLESVQEPQEALAIYETGMQVAKSQNDNHAFNELRSAADDLY